MLRRCFCQRREGLMGLWLRKFSSVRLPDLPRLKVVILGYVWPEVTSSAAGLRDWNLIRACQQRGWEVVYSSSAKENRFSESLRHAGVRTTRLLANDSSFDSWIKEESPEIVIFDRFLTEEQFGWRVAQHSPKSARVLDTQDLHLLRTARQQAVEAAGGSDVYSSPEMRKCMADIFSGNLALDATSENVLRELSSLYRSDLSLVISDYEVRMLARPPFNVPMDMMLLSRFQYPDRSGIAMKPFESRRHFSMIGNFRHAPNVDAVRWLRAELWPGIKARLPDAELHIYGAYPDRESMQLTSPEIGFIVKGPVVDHLGMLSKYRVNLAPLRFGAGIKGKITDGWWSGTPAVTTPIGAEGMHGDLPFAGAVADDAHTFIENSVSLYSSPERWSTAQEQGRTLMQTLYSEGVNSDVLVRRLEDTYLNLKAIRSKNIVGAMLGYGMHRGTMFFSRWIEVKNAKQANERKCPNTFN